MVEPDPALAPVIPPMFAPIVQVKVLAIEAVKLIFGLVPLQMVAVDEFVTTGLGLTVTKIVKGVPAQEPVMAVGVTIYSTVPEVKLLGLVSGWLMVEPDPALAPVIPPVAAPIVQRKVDGTLAVNVIFGPDPLHVTAVGEVVTIGVGLTVTVIV